MEDHLCIVSVSSTELGPHCRDCVCGEMGSGVSGSDGGGGWWVYTIPLFAKEGRGYLLDTNDDMFSAWLLYVALAIVGVCGIVAAWWSPGGCAWATRHKKGYRRIPGPNGFPIIGSLMDMSVGLAHRKLADLAATYDAKKLMAFSLGSTPAVITSDPEVARELLSSPDFADRPLKQSAQQLMFGRAIGFAPNGEYWRMLRRISAAHLFAPRRIAAHEPGRQMDSAIMLANISEELSSNGVVRLRRHVQGAALNNIMGSVFGKRFDICGDSEQAKSLREMVEEGFELLGAFNWADHLPWLRVFDPLRIHARCAELVPRVRTFVKNILQDHRQRAPPKNKLSDAPADSDFVDVLLSLQGEDKLDDEDMISVLWEMIFRGTDTTALLTEWTMAEMVLNPEAQRKVQQELDQVVGRKRSVMDEDISKLPYLQAVVKETLRMHPPGPLLSWARLSIQDAVVAGGSFCIPAGTTTMVNMWSITHDPQYWDSPHEFRAERFVVSEGGQNVDVRGNDLRLAPFGAGRRVCPGKALGLSTVYLWVAKLVHHFRWLPHEQHPVDLSEVLKLSCEMAHPLHAVPVMRVPLPVN